MLRPLRGHLCITYHLNPRQTLQHQPDCAPHATWRVPHGGGQGGVRSVASTVSTGTTRRTVRAPRIAEFAAHRLSEGVNACLILRGASQRPSLDRRLPRPPADAEVRLSGSINMASVSLVNALRSRPARVIMVGMIQFAPLSHSERGTEQRR